MGIGDTSAPQCSCLECLADGRRGLVDYNVNADYLTEIFPAPLVVVAVIASDTLVRDPVSSHSDPGLPAPNSARSGCV